MVTNDHATNANVPAEKKRTFLYEYMGQDRMFKLEEIDEILMNRLTKNKDENKFIYIIQCYRRLESHLYIKTMVAQPLVNPQQVKEIKQQLVNFFNSCFSAPETFDINNDKIENVLDND